MVAGMADDDKDERNEGVHWQRSKSVFHSATPQFNQVFSFPARRYDSELVLSLYDAISHRKVGEARESVYKIAGSAADRHLSPFLRAGRHLQGQSAAAIARYNRFWSCARLFQNVHIAFAERTSELFLKNDF